MSILPAFSLDVLDELDDPFFIKDGAHRWVYLNRAARRVMNGTEESLLGKTDFDLFDPIQARVFHQRDSLVLSTGCKDVNEEEITWKGRLHFISTKKSRFIDRQSGEPYVVGTIRDITRRRVIELLQSRTESEISPRFEELCLGMRLYRSHRYGTALRISYSNPPAEEWLSVHPDPPEADAALEAHVRTVLSAGIPLIYRDPGSGSQIYLCRLEGGRVAALIAPPEPLVLDERFPPAASDEEISPELESIVSGGFRVEEEFAALKKLLIARGLYRDEDLSLGSLSELTGIPRNRLSGLINLGSGSGFYDFINSLRVEEVCEALHKMGNSPDGSNTILDCAIRAGFKAKSTFNKAFVRVTGMTPSEYRRRGGRNSAYPSHGRSAP